MKFNFNKLNKNITLRASFLLSLVIFLLGTIASLTIYYQINQLFLSTEKEKIIEDTKNEAEKISLIFNLNKVNIKQIARSQEVIDFITNPDENKK